MNATQTTENYEKEKALSDIRNVYVNKVQKQVFGLMEDDIDMSGLKDEYFDTNRWKIHGQKYTTNNHIVDQISNFMDIIFYHEKNFKSGGSMIRDIYFKKLDNLSNYMLSLALKHKTIEELNDYKIKQALKGGL